MRRLIAFAALAFFAGASLFSGPARAQVFIVAACGTVPASQATLTAGNPGMMFIDTNGRLCGATTATNQTGTTTQAKVTIAVTNTYQQALAASATRKGCMIQYVAVAGTKGYVFFGAAPGDTTTSIQLTNGQSVNCQTPGVTLIDAVQVTGTGTDIFVVTNQ